MLLDLNHSTFTWNISLQLRHNEHDGISNDLPLYCLLNRLFRYRSKEISKLSVTGLCEGKSPVTGEFPAQRASNAENVFIWWHHLGIDLNTNTWDCSASTSIYLGIVLNTRDCSAFTSIYLGIVLNTNTWDCNASTSIYLGLVLNTNTQD